MGLLVLVAWLAVAVWATVWALRARRTAALADVDQLPALDLGDAEDRDDRPTTRQVS